jgi:hypothetical protein
VGGRVPGQGTNWYFVMPNLYGRQLDGRAFSGLAVQLTQGVAISWDRTVIQHCTSLLHPDGPAVDTVCEGSKCGKNHLYGTFTSTEERVVDAGQTLSAAGALANVLTTPKVDGFSESGMPSKTDRKWRKRRKIRRNRLQRGDADGVFHKTTMVVKSIRAFLQQHTDDSNGIYLRRFFLLVACGVTSLTSSSPSSFSTASSSVML